MTRVSGAFGAGLGAIFGGAAGAFAGSEWSEIGSGYFGPMTQEQKDNALIGGAVGAVLGAAVGGAIGAGHLSDCEPVGVGAFLGENLSLGGTPAQSSPGFDFVTDVPVQGPTNEQMRATDCWFAENRIPARPACADCSGGTIPMWARQSGVGELVSFGGRVVGGYALAAPGDPDVWSTLSPAQQTWVMQTLVKLDGLIKATTGTSCATFGPSITAAGGCFQGWYNKNFLPINPAAKVLRTDGVFDQDTLDGLRTVAALDPKNFPTPMPGTELPGTAPAEEKKKLSTGAIVGISAAGAAVLGGVVWVATRKKSRRTRRH